MNAVCVGGRVARAALTRANVPILTGATCPVPGGVVEVDGVAVDVVVPVGGEGVGAEGEVGDGVGGAVGVGADECGLGGVVGAGAELVVPGAVVAAVAAASTACRAPPYIE